MLSAKVPFIAADNEDIYVFLPGISLFLVVTVALRSLEHLGYLEHFCT